MTTHRAVRTTISRLCLALACISVSSIAAAGDSDASKAAGTFTSLTYNAEGGDLLGYELLLIPARDGLKGVFQEAQGEVTNVYLVQVHQGDGESGITFEYSPPDTATVKFSGHLERSGLHATLTYSNGVTEKITLKHTASYWDRHR